MKVLTLSQQLQESMPGEIGVEEPQSGLERLFIRVNVPLARVLQVLRPQIVAALQAKVSPLYPEEIESLELAVDVQAGFQFKNGEDGLHMVCQVTCQVTRRAAMPADVPAEQIQRILLDALPLIDVEEFSVDAPF